MFLGWGFEIAEPDKVLISVCFLFTVYPPPPIEALYVGEDALPVWFVVVQHVLHLQQRVDTSKLSDNSGHYV